MDQEDLGTLLTKLAVDVADLKNGLRESRNEMQGFKSMAQNVGASVKKALTFVGVTVGIYELVSALKSFVRESAMVGSRTETLEIAMNQVGKTYGVSAATLKYYVNELKSAGITTQESMQAVTKFLTSGLPLEQLKALATRARDIAVVAGVNTSEAFNRIIQGIITGEQETLRRMMIQVGKTEDIYTRYAESLGKTKEELNSVEKAQAMLNEVMRLSAGFAGVAAEADASVGKQLASMTRFAEEAKNSLWALLGPVMLEIVQQLTGGWKNLKTWADANRESLRAWGEAIALWIEHKLLLIRTIAKFINQSREAILLLAKFLIFRHIAGWIVSFAGALKGASVTMAAATTTAKGLKAVLLALTGNPWVIGIAVVLTGLSAIKKLQEKQPEAAPYALVGEAWGVMTPEQKETMDQWSDELKKKPKETKPKPEVKPATPEEAAREAQEALDKALREALKPTTKSKKGGKGGAGAEEDLFGTYLRVLDQQRQAEIQAAQDSLEILRTTNEKKRAELERSLAEGLIDGQTYYASLQALQKEEADAALALIEKKKAAQIQAHQDALADIDRQDVSKEMAGYLRQEEEARHRMAMAQLAAEAVRIKLDGEKKVTEELRRQLEVQQQYKRQAEDLNIETGVLLGAISTQEAALQKLYLDWQRTKQEALKAGASPEFFQALEANYQAKRADTQFGGYAGAITQGISSLIDAITEGGQDLKQAAHNIFKGLFAEALKPGLEQLKGLLVSGFKNLFGELGSAVGSAIMGVIGLIGMLLTSGGGSSSWSSSGVTSGVTAHEAIRGVIAGETSLPIAEIGTSLQDALVPTNGILEQIEENTRGIKGFALQVSIPGLEEALEKAFSGYLERYFENLLQMGGA